MTEPQANDTLQKVKEEHLKRIYEGFNNPQQPTKPKKCKHCGIKTTGDSDECWQCLGNPKRQKMLARLNKQLPTYLACPNEGEVLQIIEADSEGKPTKCYCPACREETKSRS